MKELVKNILFVLLITCIAVFLSSCFFPIYGAYQPRGYGKWNEYASEISRLTKEKAYAEAEKVAHECLEYSKKQFGQTHLNTAISLQYLTMLYKEENKLSDAESTCKQALAIIEKGEPSLTYQYYYTYRDSCLSNLADIYNASGKFTEAESIYMDSIQRTKGKLGQSHPDVAVQLTRLANFYDSNGEIAKAETTYKEVRIIVDNCRIKSYPQLKYVLEEMAEFYRKTGKEHQARELEERAKSMSDYKKLFY